MMSGKDKGTALIVAMVMIVMIAGMATALLNVGMARSRSADFRMERSRAFQIAQAAVERTRARIKSDGPATASFGANFLADEAAVGESFAGGEYFATGTKLSVALSGEERWLIRAGGRAGREIAGVEVVMLTTPLPPVTTVNPFDGAAYSAGPFTMTGGTTDSYNSDDGPYDASTAGSEGHVGSNTDVTLSGTATVNGDASAHGTVTGTSHIVSPGTYYDGVDERDLPSVKDMGPTFWASNDNSGIGIGVGDPLSVSGDTTLPPGTYYFGAVDVANWATLTIQTPCKVYMSDALGVKPNGDIVIDTSGGGSAEVYLANGGDIKGAVGISPTTPLKPSDFRIYSHGTAPIIIKTPHVDACLSIYAPDAPITIQANVDIKGSLVGKTVTVKSAGTEIHYDEAMESMFVEVVPTPGTPPPGWDVSSGYVVWRQIR